MTFLVSLALFATLAIASLLVLRRVRAHRVSVDSEPHIAAGSDGATAQPSASTVQQGIRAFMRADYEAALPLLEPAAREDHLKAQIFLSKMYFAGNGVECDHDQYVYWLRRAAGNGDKPSKAKLKKLESGDA